MTVLTAAVGSFLQSLTKHLDFFSSLLGFLRHSMKMIFCVDDDPASVNLFETFTAAQFASL